MSRIRPFLILFFLPFSTFSYAWEASLPPEGFVLKVLEPTGGKINMPKDWLYVESHRGRSFTWTLKKEDREDGTYDTGVKIQTFVGVEEATGKSPEKFVMDFFDQKQKDADKIFHRCPPQDQGLFTRVCFETQEGDFRILYSLFWGNGMDVVVVSIAGAKVEDWDQYSQTFESMSKFELIDMQRFK